MLEGNLALCAVLSLFATAISVVACQSQVKLRKSVARVLTESATQQIRTAQRMFDALSRIQKTQQTYDRQIQALMQANAQLRQTLATVSTRLERAQTSPDDDRQHQRPTIH